MTELGHGSNVCESCLSIYYITLESKILSIVSAILTDIFASTVQVRGIETVTTYDSSTGEFVINTPCESAQKYWIGGAANVTILPLGKKIGMFICLMFFVCQLANSCLSLSLN